MKRSFLYALLCFLIIALPSCSQEQSQRDFAKFSPFNDSIRVAGRVKAAADSLCVYWPGTAITFKFKGEAVNVEMTDDHGDNYFNVVIDGQLAGPLDLDSGRHEYVVAQRLANIEHTIQLIKRTEWDNGKTWIHRFSIAGNLLPLPPPNTRVMEFYGNSITAGYAIEDTTGRDNPRGLNTDNYNTYASITARHFEADTYLTVKSGIGVTVSWFPLTMPELYNRLDPLDSASRWDFRIQPQVVVVNLFQNDSWLVKQPEHLSFKQRFGKTPPTSREIVAAYTDFLRKLRSVYPNSYLICSLGCMDAVKPGSPWPGYISTAVQNMRDQKILTHFFPYIERNGHPSKEDHIKMANSLIDFITHNIDW